MDARDDAELEEAVARLVARFRDIAATSMADAPICNRALDVEAVGFRRFADRALGTLVTPWFLNFVAFDLEVPSSRTAPGATLRVSLPAGELEFRVDDLAGFGRLDMCSLFSPMFEFQDMAAAIETARAALEALLTPPVRAAKPALDRRAFLRGGFGAKAASAS